MSCWTHFSSCTSFKKFTTCGWMSKLRTVVFYLLSVMTSSGDVVHGLKLKEMLVPRYADIRESVTLGCQFDLGGRRLYSVKWYKDEFEFFRFMPDNRPQTQVFPLEGITLDESQSGLNKVTLTDLSYNSTGSYRCEVSTEGPSFETVFDNRNMTVLAYPQSDPEIYGAQSSYSVGDYVYVTCTASLSNPAPELEWYINGIKADSWLTERTTLVRVNDRYTVSLALRFLADKQHFQGPEEVLKLVCRQTVDELPPWERVVVLPLAGKLTNQKLAQERYRNGGVRRQSEWSINVAITAILIMRITGT